MDYASEEIDFDLIKVFLAKQVNEAPDALV
jgi:hypothetical protein